MKCPKCDSSEVDVTSDFDLTIVNSQECRHDFKCDDCGCLFQIIYHPISTVIIDKEN